MKKYTLLNKVAYIPTDQYLQDYWQPNHFIEYCKTCKNFKKSWACPPFDFNPLDIIKQYQHTYIIGTQVLFTPEFKEAIKRENSAIETSSSIMYEVRAQIDKYLVELEQNEDGRAYYAGSCHLCPEGTCTRSLSEPCRFPDLMRSSLEAFGFDIGRTTSTLLELELKWGKKGELPEYYILLSAFMSKSKTPEVARLFETITPK